MRDQQSAQAQKTLRAQSVFLTATDGALCERWASELIQKTLAESTVLQPAGEPSRRAVTFLDLKYGDICEFSDSGEVIFQEQVLGFRNSEFHRCDRLNGGVKFCGAAWDGPKVIFKFV